MPATSAASFHHIPSDIDHFHLFVTAITNFYLSRADHSFLILPLFPVPHHLTGVLTENPPHYRFHTVVTTISHTSSIAVLPKGKQIVPVDS